MSPDDLPLLELFNRLRKYGLQLGVGEYMAVLKALQVGFGTGSCQGLERLCCAIWVKSERDAQLFHRLFHQILDRPVETSTSESPISPLEDSTDPEPDTQSSKSSRPVTEPATMNGYPNLVMEIDDPTEVIQAVRHGVRYGLEMEHPRFSMSEEYFPVTRRQMKQSWRYLRRPVREGPPVELDVEATVEKVACEGFLLKPVLIPRRSNQADLVILVDQGGSMVPFHDLSRQLVETAQRGGRLGSAGVYYFHDCPDGFLYRDHTRTDAQSVPEVLASIGRQTVVLIISDAGAARGGFEIERVKRTQTFVDKLKRSVRRYAWLNPMPDHRWKNTTAGKIARFVPMFEMDRRGLDAAIDTLRGRYMQWERKYLWMVE